MELKPADAVNIIECDMNVDFEAPVGYQEPERVAPAPEGEILCFICFFVVWDFLGTKNYNHKNFDFVHLLIK